LAIDKNIQGATEGIMGEFLLYDHPKAVMAFPEVNGFSIEINLG